MCCKTGVPIVYFIATKKGRILPGDTPDRATVDCSSDAHSPADIFGHESNALNLSL